MTCIPHACFIPIPSSRERSTNSTRARSPAKRWHRDMCVAVPQGSVAMAIVLIPADQAHIRCPRWGWALGGRISDSSSPLLGRSSRPSLKRAQECLASQECLVS